MTGNYRRFGFNKTSENTEGNFVWHFQRASCLFCWLITQTVSNIGVVTALVCVCVCVSLSQTVQRKAVPWVTYFNTSYITYDWAATLEEIVWWQRDGRVFVYVKLSLLWAVSSDGTCKHTWRWTWRAPSVSSDFTPVFWLLLFLFVNEETFLITLRKTFMLKKIKIRFWSND